MHSVRFNGINDSSHHVEALQYFSTVFRVSSVGAYDTVVSTEIKCGCLGCKNSVIKLISTETRLTEVLDSVIHVWIIYSCLYEGAEKLKQVESIFFYFRGKKVVANKVHNVWRQGCLKGVLSQGTACPST